MRRIETALAGITLLFFLLGATQSSLAACSADNWCPLTSGTGQDLWAVWGRAETDVFAVASEPGGAQILHYNGTAWSEMASPSDTDLSGVGGTGSGVYAVGYDLQNGQAKIMYYNGALWTSVTNTITAHLFSVWCNTANDVFAVGKSWLTGQAIIAHYNGTTWSAQSAGFQGALCGVWGTSGTNVFAVGYDDTNEIGKVLHFNGTTWSDTSPTTAAELYGVWGSAANNVFVVGADRAEQSAVIFRYTGGWSEMNAGTAPELFGVWGTASNNVYAGGEDGTILHYNGTAWSVMDSGSTELLLSGVWAVAADDVYVVGETGTILYRGAEETPNPPPTTGSWTKLTTTYASILAGKDPTLYAFRDHFLKRLPGGRELVKGFYAVLPSLASLAEREPVARAVGWLALAPSTAAAEQIVRN